MPTHETPEYRQKFKEWHQLIAYSNELQAKIRDLSDILTQTDREAHAIWIELCRLNGRLVTPNEPPEAI